MGDRALERERGRWRVNERETMGERDRGGRVLCVGGGDENVGGVRRRRRRRRKVYSKLTQ